MKKKFNPGFILVYIFLCIYAITVLYPVFLMVITSFKTNNLIFANPFGFKSGLTLKNYIDLFEITNYVIYFINSIVVALSSLFFIVFFASLASYVLAKYDFKLRNPLYFYFIIGLIVPLKLGTISILKIMKILHLYNNMLALIIVNTAIGIPFGIFILTDFIKMIPEELSNSARIDGCSESKIFFLIIAPLLRPALAAVALVNFIPVYNDFWFPLILIKSDFLKTIPLATALLFGQYQTNFGLVFAVLSMASIPVIVLYLLLSKEFVKSISAGALKG